MIDIINRIHWLGHSSFVIDGSRRVYMDPFNITPSGPADLILVSHTHHDHFSPTDIKKVSTEHTTLVITSDARPTFPADVHTMRPGDTIQVKGLSIRAVPAYNMTKQFHPKTNGWLGYILTIDGTDIYHAGDTDFIPEMKGLSADIGLIPIGGTYTMDHEEAARAVQAMKLSRVVPMHWGQIVGTEKDAEGFKRLVGPAADVIIMKQNA